MAFEKTILKSETAAEKVFDYKPKEFSMEITAAAVDYVHDEDARKSDFRISDLAARQSGVSRLEDERSQGIINEQVLKKLKDVQERAYKEAYELGYTDGSTKAFEERKAEIVERVQNFDRLLSSIETMKKDLLTENEEKFVELAFEIGKKIALRDLSEHRTAIVQVLTQAISDMQAEQQITVHASPTDIALLEEWQKTTELPIEAIKRIKFAADGTVENGSCVVDLQYGQVNLKVSDRIERIWQALEKQIQLNQKS